ncbi:cytochrome P450 [Dictyobacter alpinus]|uniref:Cytochrome P450 n=1 Tax=Dictyobacter alpinus TaxID=2014873 RepID=A0A402B5B2_9CHLR|nr:cytochrome P450 [Dictyobacter alpinus]GCE26532.1 cytochrome P450 [Dictyobacter alpinus]
MTFPQDAIAAVTHHNPYPYYADLVAHKPLYYDQIKGYWIASSAAAVRAVLTSDLCRVRPLTEPVPKALLGSSAADIFQHLVRMNDGIKHCPFKRAITTTLTSIDTAQITELSRECAQSLFNEIEHEPISTRYVTFAFHLSVYVLASLIGVPRDQLRQTALWISDFVFCIAPASSPEQIERGKDAATRLLDLFRALVRSQEVGIKSSHSLLATLAGGARQMGSEDPAVIVANGIGFLSQAYEATAGLIGNTMLALTSHPQVYEQVRADPDLLRSVIAEVLRYDPPIQNTRRFLAHAGSIAEQEMKKGDVILVLLAAANRDPLANPHPEQFDIFRQDRQIFTFGTGPHACPGEAFAELIALAGLEKLINAGLDLESLARFATYRPSANARIAILTTKGIDQ